MSLRELIQAPDWLRNLTMSTPLADYIIQYTDKQELENFADVPVEPPAPVVSPVPNPEEPITSPENSNPKNIKEEEYAEKSLSSSKRFRIGCCDTIGRRPTMEDQTVILGCFKGESTADYFAVFDGHGGSFASKYCAQNLHEIFYSLLQEDKTEEEIISQMPSIFKETFQRCNQALKNLNVCQETGTTAVVAYTRGKHLWVANTGDSRAVLGKKGTAVRVTTDHKPTLDSERDRILQLKGFVIFGRVNGVLAVSRALGDFYFNPHVTCEPEIFGPFDVYDDQYQFLILACDGLWDVVDDNKAVQIVMESKSPEEGAKMLVTTALNLNSTDNITVVVIFFPTFKLNE